MSPEDEGQLRHLWDGTEDWVLYRSDHALVALTVHFACSRPTIPEVAAVRQLLPQLRHLPPAQVMQAIGEGGRLEVAPMSASQAQPLVARGAELGLRLTERDVSYTGYLPILRSGGGCILIEDDELAHQVAGRMLEAGVPVVDG